VCNTSNFFLNKYAAHKPCTCGVCVCELCKDRSLLFPPHHFNKLVTYPQWVVGTEEKTRRNGTTVMVKVTQKETIESTVKQLIDKFNDMLKKFKQHLFNIRHQFEQYRYAKTNLCCNERIIHVDFNENFSCKYLAEIQSVHFGSSHRQVTLHNGVFYVMKNQSLCDTCFCTISDCKEHEPFAIWSYMDPVLKLIRKRNPPIDTVHFFSVSPATQYRQKLNFYLLSTLVHTYGFQHATWNFSEAGHRKGAADGVGGALKRTADRLISLHYDISTPRLMD